MEDQDIITQERLYTIEDVCEVLRVSKSKLHKIRQTGFFEPPKYIGKSPRFTIEQIREYKASLKTEPAETEEKVTG